MDVEKKIPETTLETLARNFFKESQEYGFKQVDYVRFVNMLLDLSMNQKHEHRSHRKKKRIHQKEKVMALPIHGDRIQIRAIHPVKDKAVFEGWLKEEFGRNFLLSRTTALECELEPFITDNLNIIGIITHHDHKPIGAVAYLEYDPRQHKAELRKLIGEPSMRGKGYAKEATQLWIQYGFNEKWGGMDSIFRCKKFISGLFITLVFPHIG